MMIPERLKAKPRKTSSRKPSKLDQIHRSQKRILAAFKKQTVEIGILRRYVLEMRGLYLLSEKPSQWTWKSGDVDAMTGDPLDPVDGPQPPLV